MIYYTTNRDAANANDGYAEYLAASDDLTEQEREDIFDSFCSRIAGTDLCHRDIANAFVAAWAAYAQPGHELAPADVDALLREAEGNDVWA